MNFYIVMQGKTYEQAKETGVVWGPSDATSVEPPARRAKRRIRGSV